MRLTNANQQRPLHILYIVQYFNLPDEPGGSRAYQFARAWVQSGHQVTVLTGNLNHKTLATAGSRQEMIGGIRVIRVPTYNKIRGSFKRRLLNFFSFAFLSALRGLIVKKFDLVYASSTPLTVGIPGCFLSLARRKPFYFEVRDLWPESAVIAGVLTAKPIIRLAEFFERIFYHRAVKVIAVTEGVRAGVIRKGRHPLDVLFIPNGMDDWMLEAECSTPANFPFNPDQHFICTYIGAHGRWNGLKTLLEAARLLAGTNIRFLFIGDGDEKEHLKESAREQGLTNVLFYDPIPKSEVLGYLRRSHLGLICTWDHPFQAMVLANKVFDYMAAARPIVAAARGEMVNLIDRAKCGWHVDPERPERLAQLIQNISRLPAEEITTRGQNGRDYAIRHYLRSHLASRLEQTFLGKSSINFRTASASFRGQPAP